MYYFLNCFEDEQYWLEINEQLVATRQIVIEDNFKVHISAREDCLAEGEIIISDLDGICEEISKEEFQSQWMIAITPYYNEWLSVKQKYPVGTKVEGICKRYYPQGTVVVGRDYLAIYVGKKDLAFGSSLTAYVRKYDEENMWLVLE